MQRRQILKGLAGLSVAGLMPSLTVANEASTIVSVKQLFNHALENNPALLGFSNVEQDFTRQTLIVEGKLPADLNGMFFRNGPAKHERGDTRYEHLFEGDGMVQKFHIADGNIHHQGKFVNTPKYTKEQQAKKFLYSGAETQITNALPVSSADHINGANINVIPVNDELWALWEAGSATAIDPNTLAYKRQVDLGENSVFGHKLKGMPFSAHPKVEVNGDIWNFGLSHSGHIVLYHLAANGQMKNASMLNSQYSGGILHDFLITHKHILLILPSLTRNSNNTGMFSGIQFDESKAMRVLVVDKNTLKTVKTYELPAGFAFHFGNAWEDKSGEIRFDASLYPNINILHELSDLMAGQFKAKPTKARTATFTLHANGKVFQENFKEISEFPRICSHLTGLKNEYLFNLSGHENSFWSHSLMSRHLSSGKVDRFDFGDEFLVEEHIPICPNQKEGQGYLIGTALHVPSKRTCLNVFNMANISAGPMARAWLPYHLPLGFHGNFLSA